MYVIIARLITTIASLSESTYLPLCLLNLAYKGYCPTCKKSLELSEDIWKYIMDTKSNYERGEREMRLGVGHNQHVWVHVETVLESFRVGELTPWKPVQYRKLKWLNLYQPLDASSTSILLYLRYLKTQVALTRVHVELVLCLFRGYFNDIDAFLAFVRLLNKSPTDIILKAVYNQTQFFAAMRTHHVCIGKQSGRGIRVWSFQHALTEGVKYKMRRVAILAAAFCREQITVVEFLGKSMYRFALQIDCAAAAQLFGVDVPADVDGFCGNGPPSYLHQVRPHVLENRVAAATSCVARLSAKRLLRDARCGGMIDDVAARRAFVPELESMANLYNKNPVIDHLVTTFSLPRIQAANVQGMGCESRKNTPVGRPVDEVCEGSPAKKRRLLAHDHAKCPQDAPTNYIPSGGIKVHRAFSRSDVKAIQRQWIQKLSRVERRLL